jgi:flagellar hook-length control protein FliK
VELRSGGAKTQGEISAERENRPVLSFQDMLARELNQNLNNDIVRHGSILLRDGGEGLIKLSLQPDSLGNVKIRLEMAENQGPGQIMVESDEALRAFERDIHSLEQAFRDSGYEGVSFDIAHTPDQGPGGQDRQRRETDFLQPLAAAAYDTAGDSPVNGIPEPGLSVLGPGQPRIDVLA